jgi:glycosyltransferase involved in cell wall biosynthesis
MTADAVGGVWTYCLHLAEGLVRAGIGVDLAVLGPAPRDEQRAAAARIPGLTLFARPYRLEWMPGASDDLGPSGAWLQELAGERRASVVHLNAYAHGALPFAAPKLVVAHSCVLSWWQAIHGCAPPASEWHGYARAVRAGLAGADHVVAPSAAMLRALEACYGPFATRASVVPHGLPPGGRRPARKQSFVLTTGRIWDEGKNIAALVAAAPSVSWPICVAGEGPPEDDSPGTSPPLRWLGRLDSAEMLAAYRRAAIYALPAQYEPFGLSVLEAAQGGCALVLGDIESLRENWDGAAAFVDPRDPDRLAAEIEALIGDPGRRASLAIKARLRARRFRAAAMCDATLGLYQRLVHDAAMVTRAIDAPLREPSSSMRRPRLAGG